GSPRGRVALRRKLLAQDPILWLAMRDRWLPRLVWTVAWIALSLLAWGIVYRGEVKATLTFAYYSQSLFALALFFWMASLASRFFVESIHNGAMELVFVTPINPPQIVRGLWTALRRTFLFPAILVVGLK